ncbi:MAG TPA: DinB family protein [Nitrospirota bacterium]|nr:DinB family protein [Nitrospirota bacterium]
MDSKTCIFLAQYNQIANQKMDGIIRNLSNAQWNQEFAGYFKTIKQLCSHIYISDYRWLKRFGQFRDFQFTKDSLFDQDLNYNSKPFDDIADYISKREELDRKLIMFTGEITESDLEKIISFANAKGETVKKNVGGSILHIFNHQTHHRGMISLYLDMMKIDNDFSSLLPLV